MSSSWYNFIVVHIQYIFCIQTSVLSLCDAKETHPYRVCDVPYISWFTVPNMMNTNLYSEGGKSENLRKGVRKNTVSVLVVSVIWWKGQSDIRSGSYTVYYSRCEGLKEA